MKTTENKIIVKVQKEPETTKTPAGLSIPNPNVQDRIEQAVVVASGYDTVKVGDKVLINLGAGKEFTCPTDNERYRTIAANEIIVIYE